MGDRLGTPRAVDTFFLDQMYFILFSVRQASECMFAALIISLLKFDLDPRHHRVKTKTGLLTTNQPGA